MNGRKYKCKFCKEQYQSKMKANEHIIKNHFDNIMIYQSQFDIVRKPNLKFIKRDI